MFLLLDTSSSHLAIGLANEGGMLIREFHAEAGEGERGIHDARLAMETEKLLHEANVAPKEISRIGLIIGPGSFTGLRIGLSFAKGFAFATGAALVPLTVHEVMLAGAGNAVDDLIVTPGYRDDLFYMAEAEHPRKVRLVKADAFAALGRESMLLHETLRGKPLPVSAKYVSFADASLSMMAQLTVESALPLTEFDGLEPIYLT